MKEVLKKNIEEAILKLQGENDDWGVFDLKDVTIEVDYPKNENFGDFSTNIAMVLASKLKKNPKEIAEKIAEILRVKDIEKSEVVVPGYINFYLSKNYLQNLIEIVKKEKGDFGSSQINKEKKVNNEFISANPTGPLHLGNGRGGFLGDVIGRVLRKTGAEVVNEYLINDGGEQILKLGHSVLKDSEAVYGGEYIEKLNKEIGSGDVKEVGIKAADKILEEYIKKTTKEKMGINFDSWISERKDVIEKGKVDEALKILEEKKLTFEKDGALWLKTTDFGDDKDRVLVRANGEKTYIASDCGYILGKIERGFTDIIEIWGADHHGYITRFEAAARALGFEGELKFIIVQLVRLTKDGKEVRMSKRAGNVVCIDDLIEEVGVDVTRFFFLMYSADSHMDFDLGLAKERSNKNPVFYVQYAHARISSILKKSEIGSGVLDLSLLINEKELNLLREIDRFPELIQDISENHAVQRLPQYAIRLADKFHSFYNECKVIDDENIELSVARLELVKATKIVLKNTLELIGVSVPEKM
ncbi:MAG: arginine--tRNA ligase [Candidatus Moranbacteria bacterium]|nr:arginine--tRNA ligase [Candidatus Moranbacteria bacterium]